VQNDLILSI